MAEIFLILALGCAIVAFKAINDMRVKRKEQKELKENLGEEYDMYLKMRNDRKKK